MILRSGFFAKKKYAKIVVRAFTLVLAFTLGAVKAGATACDMTALFQREQAQLPATEARIQLADGSSYINPFYSGNLPPQDADAPKNGASRPQMPRTPAQMQEIFEQTRAMMLAEITKGATNLSPAQSLMVTRVKNLRFQVSSACHARAENVVSQQLINICDWNLRLPTTSLVGILAHEIGHSMDLCGLGSCYYQKVNPAQNLSSVLRWPVADRQVAPSGSDPYHDEKLFFAGMSKPGVTNLIDNVSYDTPIIAQQMNDLTSKGLLRKVDGGIPLAQNPLRAAYSCLARKNGFDPLPAKAEEVCTGPYGETGAQIWGARIMANYIKQNPPASAKEALGLFAGGELNSLMNAKGGGRPSSKIRDFNSIYLSEPAIQQALGCQPSPQQDCQKLFTPSAPIPGLGGDGANEASGALTPVR